MITDTKIFRRNVWKVLAYFFEHPYEEIYLRKLSEKTGVNTFMTKTIVDSLLEENFLVEKRLGRLRMVRANLENVLFRQLKVFYTLLKLERSGLIKYLLENVLRVSSIVLFGSAAKGEDSEKSDIDILVIGKKKGNLKLEKFERFLKRKIQLLLFSWSEWRRFAKENRVFYEEVIAYGIELHGFKPVVR